MKKIISVVKIFFINVFILFSFNDNIIKSLGSNSAFANSELPNEIKVIELPSGDTEAISNGVGERQIEAVADAKRRILEYVTGSFVKSETKVENYQVISDKISSVAKGYLYNVNIIEYKKLSNGLFGVKVKANVAKEIQQIIDKYNTEECFAESTHKIAVFIEIDKENKITTKPYQEYVLSQVFNTLLQGKCPTLVYLDQEEEQQLNDNKLSKALDISSQLAQLYKADYYIKIKLQISNTNLNFSIYSYVVGSSQAVGGNSIIKRIDSFSQSNVSDTLNKIITDMIPPIYNKITQNVVSATKIGKSYKVIISNANYGKIIDLKSLITNSSGVTNIRLGNRSSNYVEMTVWVNEDIDSVIDEIETYLKSNNKKNVEYNIRGNRILYFIK